MLIEIWSDVVCPWCYIGKRRLETALAGFEHRDDVEVVYRSFELDPTAPHHGHELHDRRRWPASTAAPRPRCARCSSSWSTSRPRRAWTSGSSTPCTPTPSTRTGCCTSRSTEGGPALQRELKEALLAAYFVRAEDVGDHDVLRAAATDRRPRRRPGRAGARLATSTPTPCRPTSRRRGRTARPASRSSSSTSAFGVSGAQPAEVFGQVLEQAWAESRPRLQMAGEGDGLRPDGCAI